MCSHVLRFSALFSVVLLLMHVPDSWPARWSRLHHHLIYTITSFLQHLLLCNVVCWDSFNMHHIVIFTFTLVPKFLIFTVYTKCQIVFYSVCTIHIRMKTNRILSYFTSRVCCIKIRIRVQHIIYSSCSIYVIHRRT